VPLTFQENGQYQNPEDHNLHFHHHENLNSQSYLLMKNKSYFEPDLKQWRVTAGVNVFLLLTLDGYASFEVLIAVLLKIHIVWDGMLCWDSSTF